MLLALAFGQKPIHMFGIYFGALLGIMFGTGSDRFGWVLCLGYISPCSDFVLFCLILFCSIHLCSWGHLRKVSPCGEITYISLHSIGLPHNHTHKTNIYRIYLFMPIYSMFLPRLFLRWHFTLLFLLSKCFGYCAIWRAPRIPNL